MDSLEGLAPEPCSASFLLGFLAFLVVALLCLDVPASGSFDTFAFLDAGPPTAPFCFFALSWSSKSLEGSMPQKDAPRSLTTEGDSTGGLGAQPRQFLSLHKVDLKPLC